MVVAAHKPFAFSYAKRIARAAISAQVSLYPMSGLLRRVLEAQSRRDLDRQASRLLEQAGGRLTDSVERDIMRRHLGV